MATGTDRGRDTDLHLPSALRYHMPRQHRKRTRHHLGHPAPPRGHLKQEVATTSRTKRWTELANGRMRARTLVRVLRNGPFGLLGLTIRPRVSPRGLLALPTRSPVSRPPLGCSEATALPPVQAHAPSVVDLRQPDPPQQDLPQDPLVPAVSSSSSPDEVIAGTSSSGPTPIDLRAHQELLCRVAQNMNLQVEEVVEVEDPVVDILSADTLSRIALTFIRTIQANATTIWQSPASIPPTAKRVERKYFVPSKDFEYLYT
ncbi:hypothetical protein UY3_04376 [Chelonia mydas]|uniref:Uncharacterized protein n=1 Tax=Chelonia mydas TaxID=8469 RepID=M7BRR7_CHEMY|nr:hypothetical protein UY3_04376 [Chelonia mydas]